MEQRYLTGLRAFVEVGGIALVAPQYVEACSSLQDALWCAKSRLHAGREWTQTDLAEAMDMSQGNLNKKLNGGNLPQDFLIKYCRVVGNALPIQWLAWSMGFEMRPATQTRIAELEQELEQLRRSA